MTRISSFRRRLLLPALLLMLGAAPAVLLPGCKSDYAKETEKHTAEQKIKDDEAIRAYLTTNNITNFTKTESGLYLVPITEGTGAQVVKGTSYQVKYIGQLLNGTKFDSSIDNGSPCGCFNVLVGANSVIAGWEEALLLMKVGDRKTLLIPSYMAYGASASGVIPADSPLMFDIEVVRQR
ncbi:FKBP-type peptidyl-prolyl cis-trans isomerase [Hymenobacter guriensis]|uniref:Peptidyl-prolyl cis-trans isomerase n=1 Tax=Hymenobacter guriensis TaxID=2793065 RepID=A0ABS0L4D5_9BACT|nr:FKBP-type peptidyl-prolyl cis-trans isomerase [Hymenobacter guriensis]MBG8554237.1 FKBP-type peptidyl-prolyl cis-trans isomerase [Hymenobacter guriensis]